MALCFTPHHTHTLTRTHTHTRTHAHAHTRTLTADLLLCELFDLQRAARRHASLNTTHTHSYTHAHAHTRTHTHAHSPQICSSVSCSICNELHGVMLRSSDVRDALRIASRRLGFLGRWIRPSKPMLQRKERITTSV